MMTKTQAKPTQISIKAANLIEHHEELPGGVHVFRIHSRTRAISHRCAIDLQTGATLCECEAGTHEPRPVNFIEWIEGDKPAPCWHRQAASEWLAENSYLNNLEVKLRPCSIENCQNVNAKFETCDDDGRKSIGFICQSCVEKLKLNRSIDNEVLDFEDSDELENESPCPTCDLTLEYIETETGRGLALRPFCVECGWIKSEVAL